MIDSMPRPNPPYLHTEPSRHGTPRWYVRRGGGPRIRINEVYDSPEFWEAYRAALAGSPPPPKGRASKGTLRWLYEQYRQASAWTVLSLATRRQRENIMKHVLETAGTDDASKQITAKSIRAGLERRKDTPSQARNFLDAMRGLYEWAVEAEHVPHDPTAGVKAPPRPQTDGFAAWDEEHVARYHARWPLGTRQRVWLDVLLYTGLRRGDVVRLGRPHIRKGVARIKTEKKGVVAVFPILSVLAKTLDAGPTGDLTFIVGASGDPLTKETFGNEFRAACNQAGVPGSAHGVRKIAATTAANNGATTAQLKALFAWTDDAMPALYTKTADTERLALDAGHMLANDERTETPAPRNKVRALSPKSKRT